MLLFSWVKLQFNFPYKCHYSLKIWLISGNCSYPAWLIWFQGVCLVNQKIGWPSHLASGHRAYRGVVETGALFNKLQSLTCRPTIYDFWTTKNELNTQDNSPHSITIDAFFHFLGFYWTGAYLEVIFIWYSFPWQVTVFHFLGTVFMLWG